MKLTIAIPTYNRPEKIQRQVRSILSQLREGVSLIVYDNSSPIPISTLFMDEELSLFTIIRNHTNIGADANIARCLENVHEGWVWPLGDDDLIKDNAVEIILKIIQENPDTCYINFGSKKDLLANSYHEVLEYWGIIGSFGRSFFMTHCLFNMNKLEDYMRFYYSFLSSQVGQVCLVIKYIETNQSASALFTTQSLINYNEPGNWNPLDLIVNSSIIIDKLYYDRKRLKSTLFKGLGDMYLTILSHNLSNNTTSVIIRTFLYVQYKLGLINLLRYNTVTLLGLVAKVLVPPSVFKKLRDRQANKYNSSVK
ncbi:MAG: glycosyltransferase [Erysipelotrichia bacterium]|nr:glycosyltransferase [Erysipelotrichia bacterium]